MRSFALPFHLAKEKPPLWLEDRDEGDFLVENQRKSIEDAMKITR